MFVFDFVFATQIQPQKVTRILLDMPGALTFEDNANLGSGCNVECALSLVIQDTVVDLVL